MISQITQMVPFRQSCPARASRRDPRFVRKWHNLLMPRVVAACLFFLLSALSQTPSPEQGIALPFKTPLPEPRQTDNRSPAKLSPETLFRRLILQIAPLQNKGGAAELASNPLFRSLATIWIALLALQAIVLIVQAYYLYKISGESRRTSHLHRDQVKLRRQSLDLARQSLILSQPPQLSIRSVEVRPRPYMTGEPFHVFRPETTVECRFLVRNTGGTRATILYSAVTLFLLSHSEPLPMVSPLTGVTPNDPIIPNMQLKPGEFTFGIFVRRTTQDEATSIKDLYVLGWVDYVDDVGNLRHTNFCRIYMRGRFVPVDDPDYEG